MKSCLSSSAFTERSSRTSVFGEPARSCHAPAVLSNLRCKSTPSARAHATARPDDGLRSQNRTALRLHAFHIQHCDPREEAVDHADQSLNSTSSSNSSNKTRCFTKAALTGLLFALVATVALGYAPSAMADTASSSSFSISEACKGIVSFILHLDKHLSEIIATHGQTTYAILFAIVFAETGLVLTPFLPGDSLLFAAGAFAATGALNLQLLLAVFIVAASIGDAVNYAAGKYLGTKALSMKLINKDYISKTEEFYAKYGGKTVVLARFVPIVRTFAPFVAGIGSMKYSEFAWYNVGGAVLWSVLFTTVGYAFGNLPFVKHNFTLVVLAIVAVSVLPIAFEIWSAKRHSTDSAAGAPKPL